MKKFWVEGVFVFVSVVVIGFVFAVLNEPESPNLEPEALCIPEPVLKFGFPVDSFIIEQATVKRNQNLSDILVKEGISYQVIDQIARSSRQVFDVRKMKQDNPYYFFYTPDSLKKPVCFIYEIDAINYVVYQLKDSLHIYRGEKPVIKEIRTASGTIRSSLWNTMKDNQLNPVLAIELSEIYAWTIDFFGIQRGDQFRVIYEESFVDSISVGINNIYACQFLHMDKDFFAFRFEQDSIMSYFDEEGKSLKKAFLKAPLKFPRISSHFSNSRMHPILKIARAHHGIDYAAPIGTPVQSIGDGVVTRKGFQAGGGGNYLYIKHNSVYTTCYMHLNNYAAGIAPGVRVRQGQVVGYVGKTGLASGPHLDFRVFRNGSPMNPLKVEAPPVEPVHEKNMPEFSLLKDSLSLELQKIRFNDPG
ncbi:peptidoglycan DD-metalloendopeptidase family protein [Gaoshiqia sp. Z1-71]|uniref:peptidoglycan DD-metalloendopeptidase family protein n=1 Tax=Gaoshiqia hydrogeniformans TaxID=3290090 RepID=UPI003BF7D354